MERVFYGYGIHGRIAQGVVFSPATFTHNILDYPIKPSEVGAELERLRSALEKTIQQLSELRDDVKNSLNNVHASVFDVQIALLKDPFIFLQTENYLKKEFKNIEFCLNLVLQNCLKKLSQNMQDRCNDLRDAFQRVFFNLLRFSHGRNFSVPKSPIFVAKTLYPSDIAFLKNFSVAGILLEDKCLTSHAIILAKNLNIPIIVGITEIEKIVKEGIFVRMNGSSGEVILGSKEIYSVNKNPLHSQYSSKTKDGVEVQFWSNYQEPVYKEAFSSLKVRGTGLVRTELLFLDDREYPTEEKQFLSYKKIVEKSNPFPVIFRTFDIGGDKSFPFFPKFKEINPFLGTRGIRLCLQYKNLFKQQLCALLRVSTLGKIKILYPMVTDAEELFQANQLLEDCKQELRRRGLAFESSVEVGTMLEIPSTLFILDQLKAQCQFFSVGTNDWVQYILSIDRTNNHLYDKTKMTHPAILKSLRKLFKYSEQLYANVGVCGEMANQFVPFLMTLGIGFRSYTSDIQRIPYLMQLLNCSRIKDLEDIVEEASYCLRSQEIWALFENYLKIHL